MPQAVLAVYEHGNGGRESLAGFRGPFENRRVWRALKGEDHTRIQFGGDGTANPLTPAIQGVWLAALKFRRPLKATPEGRPGIANQQAVSVCSQHHQAMRFQQLF